MAAHVATSWKSLNSLYSRRFRQNGFDESAVLSSTSREPRRHR